MSAAGGLMPQQHAFECEIVALGSAGSKYDLFAVGADREGDALAGVGEGFGGGAAVGVRARRAAEMLRPKGLHRLEHRGVDGRGRVVVEINSPHDAWLAAVSVARNVTIMLRRCVGDYG